MKKIPSIFVRDWSGDRSRVLNVIDPEAQWVFDGEGIATRKYDGTCCLVLNGKLYARYDARGDRTPPKGFTPCMEMDERGHQTGWVPIVEQPQYKFHRAAYIIQGPLRDGTYELCGPHLQANPEGLVEDTFISHAKGVDFYKDCPRTFDALVEWLRDKDIEGVVWHHPDGRMAKIKKKDLRLRRC